MPAQQSNISAEDLDDDEERTKEIPYQPKDIDSDNKSEVTDNSTIAEVRKVETIEEFFRPNLAQNEEAKGGPNRSF